MGSSIGKEDSIVGVDKSLGVIQSDLVPSMVLIVSVLMAEPPVLKGVGVSVVLPGTRDEFVKCVRMWVGVHQ